MKSITIKRFPALSYARAEAVNTLCVNLTFSGANVKKIMVTSCRASEGKSSLAMNIMRTMANMGRSVVLVDCDLRRSVVNNEFGIVSEEGRKPVGLAHYLAGRADENDIIYKTNIEGAYMVPVGRTLSNPLSLLNSERFTQLLDNLAEKADYVIVDAPPVGTVIDGAQIAKSVDGVLLVVRYNTIRRQELLETKMQIEQTGCPILGTVLTMVKYDNYASKKYYKSYYSKYGSYESRHAIDANDLKNGGKKSSTKTES